MLFGPTMVTVREPHALVVLRQLAHRDARHQVRCLGNEHVARLVAGAPRAMFRREGLKLDPEIYSLFSRPYVDPAEMTFAGHNTVRLKFHEQRADGVSRHNPCCVRELRRFAAYDPENHKFYLPVEDGRPARSLMRAGNASGMGSVSDPGIHPLNR